MTIPNQAGACLLSPADADFFRTLVRYGLYQHRSKGAFGRNDRVTVVDQGYWRRWYASPNISSRSASVSRVV